MRIRFVHRNMKYFSRLLDERMFVVWGFPFLLSLLILLYSKAIDNFETASTPVKAWFLDTHFVSFVPLRNHISLVNITFTHPWPLYISTFKDQLLNLVLKIRPGDQI